MEKLQQQNYAKKQQVKKINQEKETISNQKQTIQEIKENLNEQIQSQIQFDEDIQKLIHGKFQDLQKGWINLWGTKINSLHLIYALRSQSNITHNKFIDPNIVSNLILSSNTIKDEGIKQLCKNKYKWIRLSQLSLYNNNITIKGMQYLCTAAQMKHFPQLSILRLNNNQIGENENLVQFNNFEQQFMEEGLLFKFINNNTKLQQLFLSQNNLNDNDMIRLFKAKKQNNKKQNKNKIFNWLQELYLDQNNITKNGIKTFVGLNFLERYPFLRVLDLNQNKINKIGIRYFVDSINLNVKNQIQQSKLQILSLSDNDLCSQAIKILVSNKNIFNNLIQLNLSNNSLIRDQGMNYFMRACQEGGFPLLLRLEIECINLSNNGIQNIIKKYCLSKTLKSLKKIFLQSNQILINTQSVKKKLSKRFSTKLIIQKY